MPVVYAPRVLEVAGEKFTLPGDYIVHVDSDGNPLSFDIEPYVPEGKGLAPEPYVPLFSNYRMAECEHTYTSEPCDCEDRVYVTVTPNGKVVELDTLPDVVAPVGDEVTEREYVTDALASYSSKPLAVSEALEDQGFQYRDQVWVDGIPFGVIELDDAAIENLLPSIRFDYNAVTLNPRAICVADKCNFRLTYRILFDEYVTTGIRRNDGTLAFILDKDFERLVMMEFTTRIVTHVVEQHPLIQPDDFCEHGQRRFYAGRSRKFGHQPFKAKFCTAGKCEPVWVND